MIVKIDREALLLVGKEVDMAVNTEKTQYYTLVSHQENAQRIAKYRQVINHLNMWRSVNIWERHIINQNCMHGKLNSRLHSGNCLLPFSPE